METVESKVRRREVAVLTLIATVLTMYGANAQLVIVNGQGTATIAGTVRCGAGCSGLIGDPIDVAGSVRAHRTDRPSPDVNASFTAANQGAYQLINVPLGVYDLYASAVGFQTTLFASGVKISVAAFYNLDAYVVKPTPVSQYSVQCSSTTLNIDIKSGNWSDAWNDAKYIFLENMNSQHYHYGYPHDTGNAYLGLKCDQHWVYGFVSYMPNANENGQTGFKPVSLSIAVDPNDQKPQLAQNYDHAFIFDGTGTVHSVQDSVGTGVFVPRYGTWGDAHLIDSSRADFHLSIMKTPFQYWLKNDATSQASVNQNPVYMFKISRDNLLKNDTFGLYAELQDDHYVWEAQHIPYYATYPATNLYDNAPGAWTQPSQWPDIHLLQPITQTTASSQTTESTTISAPATSQISSVIESAPREAVQLTVWGPTLLVTLLITGVAVCVGILVYKRRRR
jgi:hypothetical protein